MKLMQTILLSISLCGGLFSNFNDIKAEPDMLYFNDQSTIIKPTYIQPMNAPVTVLVTVDDQLLVALKNDLMNAQTEDEMDQIIDELILYHCTYSHKNIFQIVLTEVKSNIAYYESRVNNRFDYTSIKKGLGLGIITGLALYGIKAIQNKYYKPEEQLKEQALADLRTLGIEHSSHYEHRYTSEIYVTKFTGIIPAHTLAIAQSKMEDFQTHQNNADSARGGQFLVGGAGLIAGIAGAGYIYRGLTTDCAQEFARYSLLKVKLEEVLTAFDAVYTIQQ